MQTYGAGQGDQRFGAQNVTYVSRMQGRSLGRPRLTS